MAIGTEREREREEEKSETVRERERHRQSVAAAGQWQPQQLSIYLLQCDLYANRRSIYCCRCSWYVVGVDVADAAGEADVAAAPYSCFKLQAKAFLLLFVMHAPFAGFACVLYVYVYVYMYMSTCMYVYVLCMSLCVCLYACK